MSDYTKPWYHGSPLKIDTLRKGSTITQDHDLARIFSHKPTLVSVDDEGAIKHNGQKSGFLYRIAEKLSLADIVSSQKIMLPKGHCHIK